MLLDFVKDHFQWFSPLILAAIFLPMLWAITRTNS